MELYNITFSPTRTSTKVANGIISGMQSVNGWSVTETDVTYAPANGDSPLDANGIAIISAPVYGGKMAPIAKERMKHLKADRTPCIIVAVYGNRAFENALNDMSEFVSSLGFVPVGAAAFVGEHSYSSAENPIAVGRPDKEDIAIAENFGMAIAKRFLDNSQNPVNTITITDEPSPAESLANFRNFVQEYMRQQQEAPKQYLPTVDTQLCNRCGTCIEVCPTAAISDDCLTVDPSKCIKCCACVKSCPEGARTLFSPFAPVLSANFNHRKSPICRLG